jgi:hypothetical protein
MTILPRLVITPVAELKVESDSDADGKLDKSKPPDLLVNKLLDLFGRPDLTAVTLAPADSSLIGGSGQIAPWTVQAFPTQTESTESRENKNLLGRVFKMGSVSV